MIAEEALKRRMETDGNLDLVLGNVTKLEEGGIRLKAPLVAEFVLLFSFAFSLDFGLVLQFLFDLLDSLLHFLMQSSSSSAVQSLMIKSMLGLQYHDKLTFTYPKGSPFYLLLT